MSRAQENVRYGPAIDGGEPLRDTLWQCDELWARLLNGKRYENVKVKPSYTYEATSFTENAREIR